MELIDKAIHGVVSKSGEGSMDRRKLIEAAGRSGYSIHVNIGSLPRSIPDAPADLNFSIDDDSTASKVVIHGESILF